MSKPWCCASPPRAKPLSLHLQACWRARRRGRLHLPWHSPCLGLSLVTKERYQKSTTKAKETPKIHFCPRDIRCNPQHHLLWPSQAPRQKGSTAHQQHLLAAPTSTWLWQQQRAFWGHEGYLCTPMPSLGRAGPSPSTVPARDGTVPISAQQPVLPQGQSPDFTEVAGAGTGPSRGSGTRSARLCGD